MSALFKTNFNAIKNKISLLQAQPQSKPTIVFRSVLSIAFSAYTLRKMMALNEEVKSLKGQKTTIENKNEELKVLNEALHDENQELKGQKTILEKGNQELKARKRTLKSENKTLEEQKTKLENENKTLKIQVELSKGKKIEPKEKK